MLRPQAKSAQAAVINPVRPKQAKNRQIRFIRKSGRLGQNAVDSPALLGIDRIATFMHRHTETGSIIGPTQNIKQLSSTGSALAGFFADRH